MTLSIGQIAPDGLQRHLESGGKILDHHAPLGAGKLQNLGLPEVESHVPFPSKAAFGSSATPIPVCQRNSSVR